MSRPPGRPTDRPPTWWLLVQLDLPELGGHRFRAIGPLSWTGVRALAERWEQTFGADTTACTEQPPATASRAAVGVRPVPEHVIAAARPAKPPADAAAAVLAERRAQIAAAQTADAFRRSAASAIQRVGEQILATIERKPDRAPRAKRGPLPSQLSERARAALARTRAARAAIDASIASWEGP